MGVKFLEIFNTKKLEIKTIGGVNVLLFLGRIFGHLATNKILVWLIQNIFMKKGHQSRKTCRKKNSEIIRFRQIGFNLLPKHSKILEKKLISSLTCCQIWLLIPHLDDANVNKSQNWKKKKKPKMQDDWL